MVANFIRQVTNALWSHLFLSRQMVWRWTAALGLGALTTLSGGVQAGPDKQRLDWEKLTPEQQSLVKSNGVRAKEAALPTQKYYVYQAGQRFPIEVQGEGAQATFRLSGSGTNLRYVGRGEIKLLTAKTPADLKTALETHGLELGTPMDASGLTWTVLTPPGLAGLKALNHLKESGLVAHATPDWQRDLRKK